MILDAESISRQAMRLGAAQDAHELHLAVELAASILPSVIVELGCDRGGTLYAWRQLCERVYGITWAQNADSHGEACQEHGAQVHYGDTHDSFSWAWLIGKLAGTPVDVLIVDGDHFLSGITQDIRDYGPLVRPGGLIMVHDIVPKDYPLVEVWKLWPLLRERYQTSEIGDVFGWGVIRVAEGDDFTGL